MKCKICNHETNNIFTAKIFQLVHEGKIDIWDYQWVYTCFINNGLCIMPNKNLVSNIGFGSGSTHTKDNTSVFSKLETQEITEIIHPNFILSDQKVDLLTSKIFFGNKNIFERVKNKVLRIIIKINEIQSM